MLWRTPEDFYKLQDTFEEVATDPELTDRDRLEKLKGVVGEMFDAVNDGCNSSARIIQQADIFVRYFETEDMAPKLLRDAFGVIGKDAEGKPVPGRNGHLLQKEIDNRLERVKEIKHYTIVTGP